MAITGKDFQNIKTIAVKEFMDNLQSKRFLIIGIVYFVIALLIAAVVIYSYVSYQGYVNSLNDTSLTKMQAQAALADFSATQVLDFMGNLNIVLVLLAVLVSADTLANEFKDRTIYQLISKPVGRSNVVIGKYLGCLCVVATLFASSVLLAYLLTVVLTWHIPSANDFLLVIEAILSTVLILAVYVAIGVMVSSLTKNPYLAIIGSLLAWIGLWLASAIANVIVMVSQMGQFIMGDDVFSTYPIYVKVLIWIDPLSHGLMSQILHPETYGTVAAGLPVWANLVFLVAYAAFLVVVAILVFDNRDISS